MMVEEVEEVEVLFRARLEEAQLEAPVQAGEIE